MFTDDGTVDYGKMTILLGYANEYTYNTPYKYQNIYKEAETKAREDKDGLWADNACAGKTTTQKTVASPRPDNFVTNTTSSSINTTGGASTSTGGDKDCSDFSAHAEAQTYFVSNGGSPSNNVDRLDRDGDGIACETLPL